MSVISNGIEFAEGNCPTLLLVFGSHNRRLICKGIEWEAGTAHVRGGKAVEELYRSNYAESTPIVGMLEGSEEMHVRWEHIIEIDGVRYRAVLHAFDRSGDIFIWPKMVDEMTAFVRITDFRAVQ